LGTFAGLDGRLLASPGRVHFLHLGSSDRHRAQLLRASKLCKAGALKLKAHSVCIRGELAQLRHHLAVVAVVLSCANVGTRRQGSVGFCGWWPLARGKPEPSCS
jgi:hypothetical protein